MRISNTKACVWSKHTHTVGLNPKYIKETKKEEEKNKRQKIMNVLFNVRVSQRNYAKKGIDGNEVEQMKTTAKKMICMN